VIVQKVAGSRHANVIVGELQSDCAKYQEGLVKAAQSNEELHRAMELHIANLRLLSQPLTELQKALPSSADIPRCMRLFRHYCNIASGLQCCGFQFSDAVGWAAGRASGL